MQKLLQKKLLNKHKTIAIGLLSIILIYPFATISAEVSVVSNEFDAPEFQAASVAVYDLSAKEFVYTKNADVVRPLASITKLLTGMVILDTFGYKNAPGSITVRKIIPETAMDRTLKVGEQWDAYDFLRFMMMTSSNTAAEAFGNQILPYSSFISLMNFKATSLGLPTISVENTSGLAMRQTVGTKLVETPSSYGSARDVAKLLAKTHEQYAGLIGFTSLYNYTFTSKLNGKVMYHAATSTNPLLASNPDVLGGKTGYTDASGGNLAVLVKTPQGKVVAIVVLGSTVDGRFIDVAALASSTKDFFTTK